MIKLSKSLVAVALSSYLSACGSSSDDDASAVVEPANQAPIISLEAVTGQEKQPIEVSANVSDDGTIASYQWSQVSGSEVALSGADSTTISFTAPAVDSPQDLIFALTATDDQGLSSRAEVTVAITQHLISLTIDGIATDSPIANADINVQVGEQTFSTNADAVGQYSIELQVDDDLTKGMVQINAQGKEAQAVAHLSSIVGTFEALSVQAGDDNILQSTENFAVNVTNLSTAKVALMSKANGGQAILTNGKIAELASSLDANRLLEVATAIKVVIDKAANNPDLALPEGIDNTLALLASDSALSDYITQVKDSAEFAEAAEEMLADSNITNANINEAVKAYYISACNSCSGEYFEMSATDNTGKFYDPEGSHTVTFNHANNQLLLDFSAADRTQISFPVEVVNGVSQQVEAHRKTDNISYTVVSSDNYGVIFTKRVSGITTYPNGEFDDIPFEYEDQVSATPADRIQAINLTSEGGVFSLPLPSIPFEDREKGYIYADNFTLNDDGTGHAENIDMDLTWQLGVRAGSAHGQTELNITLADNRQLWYSQLNQGQSVQSFGVLVETESESEPQSYGTAGIGKLLDDNSKFDLAKVPGIYALNFGNDGIDQFWWELWPTGEAYTFSTRDRNEDGQLSADEVGVQYGEWRINEQGRLSITRYLFADNRTEPGCFSLSHGCYFFHNRDWQLLAQDEQLIYITNTHHFDRDADGEFEYISFDNRKVRKADERPVLVQLPESSYYPAMPPMALTGLLAVDNYLNKPLYAVDSDYYDGQTEYVTQLTFKSDNSYQWIYDEENTEIGEYQVFADQSIAMVNTSVSVRDHSQFGFLLADDEVTLAARQDETEVIFSEQTAAQTYADNIGARLPAAPFSSLFGKQLVLIDYEDGAIEPTYFSMVDDTSIVFYSDSSFDQVALTTAIVTNQDGSISLDGNKLFIALASSAFGVIATDEGDGRRVHLTYFMDDVDAAKRLVSNLNQLGIYHQ
ncbi:hypothetical protein DXX93_14950 [Thalassotalea euphylliae]|uniref:PKD/Chitinase domain-containing protein n=1 Tax=Thalassotalea euphylliae TaxID=1655234 RepID=A0A3E0TTP8_9GAMM|nr:hypothetical protein [Thalassotalea euphylliae]REL27727.1 hypothetical protein DXX93_14950 [Thalassotalea euphylliae]